MLWKANGLSYHSLGQRLRNRDHKYSKPQRDDLIPFDLAAPLGLDSLCGWVPGRGPGLEWDAPLVLWKANCLPHHSLGQRPWYPNAR